MYNVRPFSGSRYFENAQRNRPDETPCAICGRGVRDPWPRVAVVVDGGGSWGDANSPEDSGNMGAWPVGNDCHRRHAIKGAS